MQFISACLPPLDDGDYTVTVQQGLKLGTPPEPTIPDTHLHFTVAGPRFELNPADVYSVFPPHNKRIKFEGQLPFVVFTRKTLPWERLIGRDFSPSQAMPWLALLLLHDTDLPAGSPDHAREVKTGTVHDLLHPPLGTRGPHIALDSYESDPCRYVDLPLSLFTAIAPRLDELPYLAHARIVTSTADKPEQDAGDGEFSVLIGNRLPHASARNTALVVSVEGFESFLPPAESAPPYQHVRLAVLHSWDFFMGAVDPFDVLFEPAHAGLLAIRQPLRSPHVTVHPPPGPGGGSPHSIAEETVAYALESGRAALSHHLRDGGRTFSWYRGPLIPESRPGDVEFETSRSADQDLRYNPASGLFDTTYAAAWQLGRLLALQNPAFLEALRDYFAGAPPP